MLMVEPTERSARLLVAEPMGSFELRDAARHREGNVKVRGPPSDLFTKPDLSGCHASNRALVRCRLRVDVRVDAQREVKHDRGRCRDQGLRLEGDRHGLSLSRCPVDTGLGGCLLPRVQRGQCAVAASPVPMIAQVARARTLVRYPGQHAPIDSEAQIGSTGG